MKSSSRTTPTIKEVALACGLSEASVSYAINGKAGVGEETRQRVLEAMRQLNYQPSAVARGLAKKRVNMLGVFFGQIDPAQALQDPYMSGVLAGIMTRAQFEGFNVALFTHYWEDTAESAALLRDGRTDGVLTLSPTLESHILDDLREFGIPVVSVSGAADSGIPVVDIDNYRGARMATEHLLSLGHRRIAYFSPWEKIACYQPRLDGFRDAMRGAGIEPEPDWIRVTGFIPDWIALATKKVLALPNPPTAIFAGNDGSAALVLETARECGVSVPEQLSVMGFDDAPLASLTTPRLSTIRQPLLKIGETAASLLIDQICGRDNKSAARPVLLAPELIVRGSTARLESGRSVE